MYLYISGLECLFCLGRQEERGVDETFETRALDAAHTIAVGRLPDALLPDAEGFEALWALHPTTFHEIHLHGRRVKTPRWQKAYGMDYRYTGNLNRALPLSEDMEPFAEWAKAAVDERLNGLLFNWYEAQSGHYIGAHRDSRANMIEGCPIVTISLGEARVFRLRPWKARGFVDVAVPSGSVLVLPYATNLAWTHEVPHFARYCGRRISITLRGFEG